MARKSLVGVAADICSFLSVNSLENRKDVPSQIHRLAYLLSIFAKIINVADIIIDFIFVYDLSQLPAGQRGWSILMGISTILAILLSRSYDSNVMVDALDRYGYSLNYAYYFGTNLCISFLIEDTATLMLFSTVSGAFNRDSLADVLNLVSSLASAVMVSVFILIGGFILPGRLLSSGDSLGVLTKVIYAHSFLLGVLVSLRIPKGRKQKIPEFFMKREEDDENYEDGVALTSTSTSKQEIV
eukprot:328499-Ditylum_brightwellii.AAC.1